MRPQRGNQSSCGNCGLREAGSFEAAGVPLMSPV